MKCNNQRNAKNKQTQKGNKKYVDPTQNCFTRINCHHWQNEYKTEKLIHEMN